MNKGRIMKVYKVVRKLKDGTLVSSWKDDPNNKYQPRLTYALGQTTTAPTNSGIFCHRELGTAKESGDIASSFVGVVEVYEATPIGEEIPFWFRSFYLVNYPAITLGKLVHQRKDKQ